MSKKKYYVVFKGSRTGVYNSEYEARKYATNMTKKCVRSYKTEAAAYNALRCLCNSKSIRESRQMHESHFFLVFEGTHPGIYNSIDEARKYSRTTGKSSIKEYHRREDAEQAYNRLKREGKIICIPTSVNSPSSNMECYSNDVPNADTIAAIQEVQKLKSDPSAKTYSSFEELLKEIDEETHNLGLIGHHGHGHAYIDGSYYPKTGKYGYGVVLHYTGSDHGEIEFCGSESDPLDVRSQSVAGEILAVKAAVTKAVSLGLSSLTIYHDFDILATWANSPIESLTGKIQKEYCTFIDRMRNIIYIEFVKVSAHTGLMLNERADALARSAVIGC